MSVFRAPFEDSYRRLGTILDREEALLRGRTDAAAVDKADAVSNARIDWIIKRKDLEPLITKYERWIWGSISVSALGLFVSALWPALELPRVLALAIICLAVGPLVYGAAMIVFEVRNSLSVVSNKIDRL